MEVKQVIIVRKDLKLGKGKLAAQVAHASLSSCLKVMKKDKKLFNSWMKTGAKKVVLRVKNVNELLEYKKIADKNKVANALITDAGRTQIKPGTITCLGIGPDLKEKIDKISGNLKML